VKDAPKKMTHSIKKNFIFLSPKNYENTDPISSRTSKVLFIYLFIIIIIIIYFKTAHVITYNQAKDLMIMSQEIQDYV
jgi:hypothetical protein